MFKIAAHRGGNSWDSLYDAIEKGYDFAELDVHLSHDDYLIVQYSPIVHIVGRDIYIKDLCYSELPDGDKKNLILLSDVFTEAKGKIDIIIDIKCVSSWYSNIEIRIANLIREYNFYQNCWVISFNHNYLTQLKEYDQHINTALMYVGCLSDEKSYWKRTMADGVEVCIDYFTADTAENAHKLGLKLIGWCTEDFGELDRLISHNTDIITIEQEDKFLNYLKKRGDIT